MDKIEELRKDLSELQSFFNQSSRPKVKDILILETRRLETELAKLQVETKDVNNPPISSTSAAQATSNKRYQIKINNYAWDQTNKVIKFYVNLPKVGTLSSDNVKCSFSKKSLELNVSDLDGKDYYFVINKLLDCIEPENSFWKTKNDSVIITCEKVKHENWSHVTELEKKEKDLKLDMNVDKMDPNEGLMSLMKNMYERGDDEMKRTIMKAWSESQSKMPTH